MEIIACIISLLATIINWVGFLTLITVIIALATPFLYQNDISMRIKIKNFILISLYRKNDDVNIKFFH